MRGALALFFLALASACPAGMYHTSGGCEFCKTQCPAGKYTSGSCDGSTTTDEVSCNECRSCPSGQYQSPACDGKQSEPSVCKPCSTGGCLVGYYRAQCSGGQDGACLPCTACPTGKYSKGCGGSSDGVCTPCSTCGVGWTQYRACSALEDTGCKGGPCNTTVPCGALFCNYPAVSIPSCDWKWASAGAAINFLCVSSNTQGACQECPPGWTASGAYCVECKQGSSCDRAGAPKCDGQCAAAKYPTCDVATARSVCSACTVNQTVLSAGHRRLTRGGVLDAPELCDAYFQCGVGYYLASPVSSAAISCEACEVPESSQAGYEFASHGLTFGDKFSCVYRAQKPAATSGNGVGQYGSPLTSSCPSGYTSEPKMAPTAAGCVPCPNAPLHGGFDLSRFDCAPVCLEEAGYERRGDACVKADKAQIACDGLDGYGLSCEPSLLPWSDPGYQVAPEGGVRSTVTLMQGGIPLTALDSATGYRASSTTLYDASGANMCSGVVATGSNLAYVQDRPLFTAVCGDREMHTFYMLVKADKFAYVFLERAFGNNNRYVIWQVQANSGTVGQVWQSWRLPGKVCSATWVKYGDKDYLYMALCGSPFLVFVGASDLSDSLPDTDVAKFYKGGNTYAVGRRVDVLIGQDAVGKADGMRDFALFGASLSVASTSDPKRLLVADRDNCRLVDVVIDSPGSFLTRATTIGSSACYSGALPTPFPRLLSSVLGGRAAIFVTDLGVMQIDALTRSLSLILAAGDFPIREADPMWIGADSVGRSIFMSNSTHIADVRRKQVQCPPRHESKRGGYCSLCNEESYVSAITGRCTPCSRPTCTAGVQRLVQCADAEDAKCEACAVPVPAPAFSQYTFDASCSPMPKPPCPVGYYTAASGVYCTACPPPWSATAYDTLPEAGKCECFQQAAGGARMSGGVCVVDSPFGAEAGPYLLPGWAHGLNCTYEDDGCRQRGCYLSRVLPRNCTECPAGLYGPGGMWCERCPGFRDPSPARDSCLCRAPSAVAEDGSGACVCPAGHAEGGAAGCTPCQPGTFKPDATAMADNYLAQTVACQACPAGTGSEIGATSCAACPSGSYRNALMSRCARCVADSPVAPYYPRDPKTGTSCTACRAACSTGERWQACPANGTVAAGMFACEQCDVPLFSSRTWVAGASNRDCLWECKGGYYARNANCWPCTRPTCDLGYVFTPCGKYEDAHCQVQCVNATKPDENSAWGPGCTWRCVPGYVQREKVYAGWVEYACELETLLPWSGWW
jgi:hypothetical protein